VSGCGWSAISTTARRTSLSRSSSNSRGRERRPGADGVATRLDELIVDAQAAIEELRALGHGIYPRELRDGGLSDALRSLAGAAPIRVRVIADAIGRYHPTVEEAVFFCAREAIQNATKHAGARAHVALSLAPRRRP
jgi:signal transduction histidine kinase